MPDGTYQTKVYEKQGGDEIVVASGGKITVESGGLVDLSAAAGAVTFAAGEIEAAELGANLKTGYIPLPLSGFRLIATNDVAAKGAADGGTISLDTDPTLKRVNAATDKKLRIGWAAASVVEVQQDFAYPPDLDDTAPVVVNLLMAMAGATDTPVVAVGYFENVGDTNAGGNTAAITGTPLARYSVPIGAADVGAYPAAASLTLIPAAHGTDALYLYGAYITYTRKT